MQKNHNFMSYQAYLDDYSRLPVEELVIIFNRSHANNRGWVAERANSGAALRDCFLRSGYDVSDFIGDNDMYCRYLLAIDGQKIRRILHDNRESCVL